MFLVLEGIDGVGKSTQANLLAPLLTDLTGRETCVTHEPYVLTPADWADKPLSAQLDAYIIDREEHISDVIEPALTAGYNVICDRYFLSTWVYQVNGYDENGLQGISERSQKFNEHIEKTPVPDLTIVLDASVENTLKRLEARGDDISGINTNDLYYRRSLFANAINAFEPKWQIQPLSTNNKKPEEVLKNISRYVKANLKR